MLVSCRVALLVSRPVLLVLVSNLWRVVVSRLTSGAKDITIRMNQKREKRTNQKIRNKGHKIRNEGLGLGLGLRLGLGLGLGLWVGLTAGLGLGLVRVTVMVMVMVRVRVRAKVRTRVRVMG